MKKWRSFSGEAEARTAAIVAKHSVQTLMSVTILRRGRFVWQSPVSARTMTGVPRCPHTPWDVGSPLPAEAIVITGSEATAEPGKAREYRQAAAHWTRPHMLSAEAEKRYTCRRCRKRGASRCSSCLVSYKLCLGCPDPDLKRILTENCRGRS